MGNSKDDGVEMSAREREDGGSNSSATLPPPVSAQKPDAQYSLHPAFYVVIWIALSSSVILYNKWILDPHQGGENPRKPFKFPIFLTTWHLVFATLATQVMAKTTTLLDGRKNVRMTGKVYLRAICPIGLFFSLSLICGNQAYLYLSVAFIQMLKATTPVAVLVTGWLLAIDKPNLRVLGNVSFIVIGVIIASYGEIAFVFIGFLFQAFGILFEATRLVMVQRLLSSAEYKMDPLVSLYYFAPVCALMNFILFLVFESGTLTGADIANVGMITLILNAAVAFGLNVSVVFLIGKTSSLVLTLCGVLKDILLVVASVLIWGTHVSYTQMFGYSIALGGLVYYKLGADKLREHYHELRLSGSEAWGKYNQKYPLKKASYAAGILFTVLLLFGGFRYTAGNGTTVPVNDAQKRDLDIVVSMYKENAHEVRSTIEHLKSLNTIHRRDANVIIYNKDPSANLTEIQELTGADSVLPLPNHGREGGTYLSHIVNNWDDLARHTLFVQAQLHDSELASRRLEDYFSERTGVLSIGFGHATCKCGECKDPWGGEDTWNRVPQIWLAVNGELCPDDEILMTYAGQFVASDRRIKKTGLHTYKHLKEVLESDEKHWVHSEPKGKYADTRDDPKFGHVIERSWMIMLHCSDPRLARECGDLRERRKEGDADEKCQCVDEDI